MNVRDINYEDLLDTTRSFLKRQKKNLTGSSREDFVQLYYELCFVVKQFEKLLHCEELLEKQINLLKVRKIKFTVVPETQNNDFSEILHKIKQRIDGDMFWDVFGAYSAKALREGVIE